MPFRIKGSGETWHVEKLWPLPCLAEEALESTGPLCSGREAVGGCAPGLGRQQSQLHSALGTRLKGNGRPFVG